MTPDMSVFAKAISNGYPMAAVVGRREIMAVSERMFISSAYWDDNVGIAASIATISELERRQAPAQFHRIGDDFRKRIAAAAAASGVQASCVGASAHLHIHFAIDDPDQAHLAQKLFVQENARRGLILSTGLFFNCAHDTEALEFTEKVVAETFSLIGEGLRLGDLSTRVDSKIREDSFRRLVR